MAAGILGAVLAFHANYGYDRPLQPGIPMTFGDFQSDISMLPYPYAKNPDDQNGGAATAASRTWPVGMSSP